MTAPAPDRHLTDDLVARHRERRLTPAEVLSLHEHLEACAACRERLLQPGDLAATHAAFGALSGERLPHPDEAALEAHVRGTLTAAEEREMRAHLARCGPCLGVVRDLLALREAEGAPAPAAARRANPIARWLAVLLPAGAVGGLAVFGTYTLQVRPAQERVALLESEARGFESRLEGEKRDLLARAERLEAERERLARAAGRVPALEAKGQALEREQAALRERLAAVGRELEQARAARPGPGRPPRTVLADARGVVVDLGDGKLARQAPLAPEEAQALTRGTVVTAAEPLQGPAPTPRGARGPRFQLVAPVGTLVRETRPRLRWQALPGAARYRVTLTDETARRALPSPDLTAPEWTPPELTPGSRYSWQVEAFRADEARSFATAPVPPDPAARFQVLDEAGRERLAAELARAGDSEFARALALARAGLLDEADAALGRLLERNPASRELRRLRDSLRKRD